MKQKPSKINDNDYLYDIWIYTFRSNRPVLKEISKEAVLGLLYKNGFYRTLLSKDVSKPVFVLEKNGILSEVQIDQMRTFVYQYIGDQGLEFKINSSEVKESNKNLREIFLKCTNNIFRNEVLIHLPIHTKRILRDEKNASYLFFENIIIKITKDGYTEIPYKSINEFCIWDKQIVKRKFSYRNDFKLSPILSFINNVCDEEDSHIKRFFSVLGYMLHLFYDTASTKFLLLYDRKQTNINYPEGGTGKGIALKILSKVRASVIIDGKHFDPKNRFKFSMISADTQLVVIDDVKPDFNVDILNSCVSEGWTIEPKGKPEIYIPPELSPKIAISSNNVLKNLGSTPKRRQLPLMLGDHYQQQILTGSETPVLDEHGHRFFDDWSKTEWNRFYSCIINFIQFYFKNGIINYDYSEISERFLAKTSTPEFSSWAFNYDFQFNHSYDKKALFEDFKENSQTRITQKRFTSDLQTFAQLKRWKYDTPKSNGKNLILFIDKNKKTVIK